MPRRAAVIPTLRADARFPPERHPVTIYLANRDSPRSRRAMRTALENAARLLTHGRLGAEFVPWHRLTHVDLVALRAALLTHEYQPGKRYAPATANLILTAVKGVLAECYEQHYLSSEQYLRLSRLKRLPGTRVVTGRMLSAGELAALFAACGQDPSAAGRRDAAILAVLIGAGLRRSELAHLDIADYAPSPAAVRVRSGKGDKDRQVPLNRTTAAALGEWLAVHGPAPGPLFVPLSKGGGRLMRRLSDKAVTWILRVRGAQAGVAAFSPHDCRRTFISNLIDAGVDLVTVAHLAGHASVTTTAKYDRRGEAAKRQAAELLTVPFVPRPPSGQATLGA